jgi:hypothetical protein
MERRGAALLLETTDLLHHEEQVALSLQSCQHAQQLRRLPGPPNPTPQAPSLLRRQRLLPLPLLPFHLPRHPPHGLLQPPQLSLYIILNQIVILHSPHTYNTISMRQKLHIPEIFTTTIDILFQFV